MLTKLAMVCAQLGVLGHLGGNGVTGLGVGWAWGLVAEPGHADWAGRGGGAYGEALGPKLDLAHHARSGRDACPQPAQHHNSWCKQAGI